MSEFDPDVAAFYARGEEQTRLTGVEFRSGRLERLRTEELLARHLPPVPAVIADVGGGAGIYALPLAARGYEVHLVDPVDLHIRQASEEAARRDVRLATATVGDARALSLADASADAVLLLGPLYHLLEASDRAAALAEAARVLRPGGLLAAAGISRFASNLDGLFHDLLDDPEFEELAIADLRDGRHLNPSQNPRWFTTAYFHDPDELRAEVAAAGFDVAGMFAVEGPGAFLADVNDRLADDARRESLLRALRRLETEPSLMGASPHMLAIAVRPSN
jgi:ubiquinone/menaquinone biosynthesis C-methylase UbiE